MSFARLSHGLMACLAVLVVTGCASISPEREDFVIVEGRLSTFGASWDCGTVPRDGGGYFYVCDMPLEVHRVIFGRHEREPVTARFFAFEVEREDDIVVGPHWTRDGRAAAILWRREDGSEGTFVLSPLPGRWCVPDWMVTEFAISAAETVQLSRAGYPLCSAPANE